MKTGHRIIQQLKGHSGSEIYLKEYPGGSHYVEKIGNTDRNVERMTALYQLGYRVPKIYHSEKDYLLMEYIHGLDMKNYLLHNSLQHLYNFISGTIDDFSNDSVMVDYTEIYHKKLSWLDDCKEMPFTKKELIDKLPKLLPRSTYHGDFTLENILYTNPGFCMIDPVTIEYDSYVFDIAKLRQDLECKWFLRNTNIKLDTKLEILNSKLKHEYEQYINDYLLILMLLRVYLHTKPGDSNHLFIMKEIYRLWK
jgi:RIO-like serine/threonine protein kinase